MWPQWRKGAMTHEAIGARGEGRGKCLCVASRCGDIPFYYGASSERDKSSSKLIKGVQDIDYVIVSHHHGLDTSTCICVGRLLGPLLLFHAFIIKLYSCLHRIVCPCFTWYARPPRFQVDSFNFSRLVVFRCDLTNPGDRTFPSISSIN